MGPTKFFYEPQPATIKNSEEICHGQHELPHCVRKHYFCWTHILQNGTATRPPNQQHCIKESCQTNTCENLPFNTFSIDKQIRLHALNIFWCANSFTEHSLFTFKYFRENSMSKTHVPIFQNMILKSIDSHLFGFHDNSGDCLAP